MNILNKQELASGVIFNTIKDNRFKTIKISANIYLPLDKETASVNALLCYMLVRCCKKYPDFTTLSKKLGSLYGAELNGSVSKFGDMQCLNISVSGLDDRYTICNEQISSQLCGLLCEAIFNPKVDKEMFDYEDMLQEKRQLLDMIDSEFNDKRIFAVQQLIGNMCANEKYGISRCGTKEQIEKITVNDLYKAWENMLETAYFDFTFVGDSSPENAIDVIKTSFSEIKRNPVSLVADVIKTVDETKNIEETMEVAQSKLEIGFRTSCAEPEKDAIATRLMCSILGGTATSKLFNNVREKKSLCYYCSSRFFRLKGILIIESGVEIENINAAKEAILNEVEEMKKGNITDFELESAKLAVTNSFHGVTDTVTGTVSWYSSQIMDASVDTPQQAADKINAITKEEIVAAANKLKLDTIFTLKSKVKE